MDRFKTYLVIRGLLSLYAYFTYIILYEKHPSELVILFTLSVFEALFAHILPVNGLSLKDKFPAILLLSIIPLFFLQSFMSIFILMAVISDVYINVNTKYAYLYHTIPSFILTTLLYYNVYIAYASFAITKIILTKPSFTLKYNFNDHKHLYITQIITYLEQQLQNLIAEYHGVTALFVILQKIDNMPASYGSILYQVDENIENLTRIGIVVSLILSFFIFFITGSIPLLITGLSFTSAIFYLSNAQIIRKKAKNKQTKDIMKSSIISSAFSIIIIIIILYLKLPVYYFLLSYTSQPIKYLLLRESD